MSDRGERLAIMPIAALAAIGISDLLSAEAGSVLGHGVLDEIAHLATGALVVAVLRPRSRAFVVALLASSVLIDLDHIPQMLHDYWLTRGTPRPYPHSLITLTLPLAGAILTRGRARAAFAGIFVGIAVHFFRDLSEPGSGVALLWPFSDHSFSLPYGVYAAAVLLTGLVAVVRQTPGRPRRVRP